LGFLSVFITDNAIDADILIKEKNIALIFMDINIKGPKDGLQLATEISKKYNIQIVFITSYQDTQTIQEASLSTPLGYLIKPIIKAD
ncbi:response regulator, partial [Aliarcobacter butzleri]